MTIYAVIIEDRHADVEVLLFSTEERARQDVDEYLKDIHEHGWDEGLDPDDVNLPLSPQEMAQEGILFFACYSTEGDCVWIRALEVDA